MLDDKTGTAEMKSLGSLKYVVVLEMSANLNRLTLTGAVAFSHKIFHIKSLVVVLSLVPCLMTSFV